MKWRSSYALYNVSCIKVYKRPDVGLHLEPKHVAMNEMIKLWLRVTDVIHIPVRQFSQCLLQIDSSCRSLFCLLSPSLDSSSLHITLNSLATLILVLMLLFRRLRFPRNAFFTVPSSGILTRWPAL